MARTSLPRWARPASLLPKAKKAALQPRQQKLSWLINHGHYDLIEERLEQWDLQRETERGQAFWNETFPAAWKHAFRENNQKAVLAMWRRLPTEMPLPTNTLSLWMGALSRDREFGSSWSDAEQQAWLKEMRRPAQKMTAQAWEQFGQASIAALCLYRWTKAEQRDDNDQSFEEVMLQTAVQTPSRVVAFLAARVSPAAVEQYGPMRRDFSKHLKILLESQPQGPRRDALASHLWKAIGDDEWNYDRERDPSLRTLAVALETGCADTEEAAKLFERHITNVGPQGSLSFLGFQALYTSVAFPARFSLENWQAETMVGNTLRLWEHPTLQTTDSLARKELNERLGFWNFLKARGLVPDDVDAHYKTTLKTRVDDLFERIAALAPAGNSDQALEDLYHELKANRLDETLPAVSAEASRCGPRF